MSESTLLMCYQKGCGQMYDPSLNTEVSCKFHPGFPVFHDAMKGWSCCKKRSTDFTEFLSMPGCTTGVHSNEKPSEPVKAEPSAEEQMAEKLLNSVMVTPKPKPEPKERPSSQEPLQNIEISTEPSLSRAMAEQLKDISSNSSDVKTKATETDKLAIGTSCKNLGCTKSYQGEQSNEEECCYHSGQPIFHEGWKFWSCCNKKSSDFEEFLHMAGCQRGKHLWFKQEDQSTRKDCRYDHHETGQFVTVTVYCKMAIPSQSCIKANQVSLDINIAFEKGGAKFVKKCTLKGMIDPEKSKVKMFASKVEINLRKAEPHRWGDLEYKDKPTQATKQ